MKFWIVFACLFAIGCANKTQTPIVKESDYLSLISEKSDVQKNLSNQSEINFWKTKLVNQKDGFLYQQKLGASLLDEFERSGDVNYLYEAKNNFISAADKTTGKTKSQTLLSLSSLSIQLHQFRKALGYAFEAENFTEEIYAPRLMQFDAMMEIGYYEQAFKTLQSTERKNDFDFMVRMSKFQDHIGQLDSAIYYMETALDKVKNGNPEKWLWSLASLGDYYGHNGDIAKSYKTFVEVLRHDNMFSHALEGIAWILFAHDGNPEAALKIAMHLDQKSKLPDQKLFIAEIHEYLNRPSEAKKWEEAFIKEARDPKYGNMYNGYIIDLFSERDIKYALELAQEEIVERPVPQSYTLYAWSLYHDGQIQEAFKIINDHVLNKSFEPSLLYKSSIIAAAAGEYKIASQLVEECKAASFELGPIISEQLEKL